MDDCIRSVLDDCSFDLEQFLPYIQPALYYVFELLSSVSDSSLRRRLLHVLNAIVLASKHHVR